MDHLRQAQDFHLRQAEALSQFRQANATTDNPTASPSPPQDSSHSLIELNSLNRIKMNRITANRIELIKSKFNEIESNEICPGVSNLCPDFKRQHHHSEC